MSLALWDMSDHFGYRGSLAASRILRNCCTGTTSSMATRNVSHSAALAKAFLSVWFGYRLVFLNTKPSALNSNFSHTVHTQAQLLISSKIWPESTSTVVDTSQAEVRMHRLLQPFNHVTFGGLGSWVKGNSSTRGCSYDCHRMLPPGK